MQKLSSMWIEYPCFISFPSFNNFALIRTSNTSQMYFVPFFLFSFCSFSLCLDKGTISHFVLQILRKYQSLQKCSSTIIWWLHTLSRNHTSFFHPNAYWKTKKLVCFTFLLFKLKNLFAYCLLCDNLLTMSEHFTFVVLRFYLKPSVFINMII